MTYQCGTTPCRVVSYSTMTYVCNAMTLCPRVVSVHPLVADDAATFCLDCDERFSCSRERAS